MTPMMRTCVSAALVTWIVAAPAWAGQPLEAETARIAPRGTLLLEAGVEHQTSGDGQETHVPIAIEYVPFNRFEVLVEPVLRSQIRTPGQPTVSGIGDVEVTASVLARLETARDPAVAFAGEVKLPTAENRLIGSDKPDYAGYIIASKRFGHFDTHANLSYTIVGRPPGIQAQNVGGFALATELSRGRIVYVAEVLGSTAALAGNENPSPGGAESTTAPEIGGAELVGTLGARYAVTRVFVFSLGVSYDYNNAVLIHPGLAIRL